MATVMTKFTKGIVLKGESSDVSDNLEGTLFQNSSTSRIKSYIEGAVREVLTNSQSQVLTNKTINADTNSISNIQTSTLKAGVLNTSTSLASASDTQIPSALATKTYTDNSVSGKMSKTGDSASGKYNFDNQGATTSVYVNDPTIVSDASIAIVDNTTGSGIGGISTLIRDFQIVQTYATGPTTYSATIAPNSGISLSAGTSSASLNSGTGSIVSNGSAFLATQDQNIVTKKYADSISDPTIAVNLRALEDITTWTKGNNASFLGGGVFAGTFAKDTSTPLNGSESYKYTQASAGASLNDYFASAAQPVAQKFRGVSTTLYFPYTYNGNSTDIEVIIFDATNSSIIPNSAFVQASSTNAIFKTTVVIPTTCASIRIGFMVRVANSSKIFAFDDIQLTSDTTIYATLAQTETIEALTSTSTFGSTSTGVPVLTITKNTNLGIIAVDSSAAVGTSFRALRKCTVSMSMTGKDTTTAATVYITRNATILTATVPDGVLATQSIPAGFSGSTTSSIVLEVNDILRVQRDATSITSIPSVTLTAVASSNQVLAATESFSTDNAPLVYASSGAYSLTTLANAPVGTFITFTYAANGNVRTQTTTAPTQSIADMNLNGIQLFNRVYASASTSASPACIAIQIGKGLKGRTIDVFKSTGKSTAGNLDYYLATNNTTQGGILSKDYNETTGVLLLDPGQAGTTAVTSAFLNFSDGTSQSNGYYVINASKNPALSGINNPTAVAARYETTAGNAVTSTIAPVVFATQKFDTNNAYNTTTGEYTVPVSGKYLVTVYGSTASTANWTVGQQFIFYLYKNGSLESYISQIRAQGTLTGFILENTGTALVNLAKGDILTIQASSSVSTTLRTTAGVNWFSIIRTNEF